MHDPRIRSILIVGGGTAGWISAAVLARFLNPQHTRITLVESDEIGIVGVGEATVPLIRNLNGLLGIDEHDIVAATNGTFKLGIEFRDWGHVGNRFFHGFGDYGDSIQGVAPHHHWLRLRAAGDDTPLGAYSLPWALASRGRFAPPAAQGLGADYRHALHFDAALYARYLRTLCERNGVQRVEGRIVEVDLDGASGHVAGVTLADGRRLEADFYVDCSGFRGLLIEDSLHAGYEDWSHWLPCDSAVVAPSEGNGETPPHTISTAREAGWQWRIPLQHRDGNGHVYASAFTTDARAEELLLANLPGQALAAPRILRFKGGRRRSAWVGNCVAIGLAAGFLEPLESTSIQLIQTAAARLIDLMPDRNFDPALATEYNRLTAAEFERLRDFIILHYTPTRRTEPLWAHVRNMPLPDTLAHKLELWTATGRVPLLAEESYQEPSWTAIFLGLGVIPRRHDPLVDQLDQQQLQRLMETRRTALAAMAERLPRHDAYIARHCAMRSAA